jgi:hypothetical protein
MFEEVYNTLDRAIKLDESKAFVFAVDSNVKQLIIDLNTKNQLGEDGIDIKGDSLGEYADFTIQKKETEGVGVGSITDHITFYDTGDYWKSWMVTVNRSAITISVNEAKFAELVGDLGFDPEHVGLTKENMNKLTAKMLINYQNYVRKQLRI